jgi:hypothetical protein
MREARLTWMILTSAFVGALSLVSGTVFTKANTMIPLSISGHIAGEYATVLLVMVLICAFALFELISQSRILHE